jgi:hypothetical protein
MSKRIVLGAAGVNWGAKGNLRATAALLRRGVRPTDTNEIVNFPAGALTEIPQASGPLNAMGRGALVFTAKVDGDPVRFVIMHLKSKLLAYPGNRFSPKDEDERARWRVRVVPSCR